jgi:hypothetical protein
VEIKAELNATNNVNTNAKETDAAPDDHVRVRQVGLSTFGLVDPNTPTAQQKSLAPVSPEDNCPVP